MTSNFTAKPLVSAIISTYKSERFLKGKLEDLLNQSLGERLEIIVVNSGSPENEDLIMKDYLHYKNIKYIRTEERETIYQAWNRGIKLASGKYITNANTDDRLRIDAYEYMAKFLDENPDVGLIYTDQFISTRENETFEEAKGGKRINYFDYDHLKMLDKCIIGSQPFWRGDIHEVHDVWFNGEYEVCGDHDFELQVAEIYRIVHLKEVLGTFYKSPSRGNKEYENIERNHAEVKKIREKHIRLYFDAKPAEAESYVNKIKRIAIIPFPIYGIVTKYLDHLFKDKMYRQFLFHTADFMTLYLKEYYNRNGNHKMVERIERRYSSYLKFKKRIQSVM